MMGLSWEIWALAAFGCFLTGLAKGGLPGVGNITVLIFASVFEPKASVGLLLPILISADIVAVVIYRRTVDWRSVWRLWPWMALGVVFGTILFGAISSEGIRRVIGFVVLAMTLLQILRKVLEKRSPESAKKLTPQNRIYSGSLGLIGGVATMLANAAGPVGQLFLLSAGLPKTVFVGTSAWIFFLINVFKLPFQAYLGILHVSSLSISFRLMPFAMLGAFVAPVIVRRINDQWFVRVVWFFVIVAGIKLLFF